MRDAEPLRGKIVAIVGGSSGLGYSATRACVEAGASVVVVGRDRGKLARCEKEFGEKIVAHEGDATDSRTADQAIARALNAFGGFDALYHVAGGSGRQWGDGPLHEISDEAWEKTIQLNLSSLFYSNRAALRAFLERKTPGVILNMSSVLAYSPSPRFFSTHAYAAAKAAIIGLTRSAAARYATDRIRINAVAPGLVETPMSRRAANDEEILEFIKARQPLDGGRIGAADDLDSAVVFLLSDESKFVTGQVLAVDGGWTLGGEGSAPR